VPPASSGPCAGGVQADPGLAASSVSGDIYASVDGAGGSIFLYRKPAHTTQFIGPVVAMACDHPDSVAFDRCFIAMGPWPAGTTHSTPEAIYACASAPISLPCRDHAIYASHSLDADSPGFGPGMSWGSTPGSPGYAQEVDAHDTQRDDICQSPPASTYRVYGDGAYPLVLPQNGRIVMGYLDLGDHGTGEWEGPCVTYTNTGGDVPVGGHRWQARQQINQYSENGLTLDIVSPARNGPGNCPSLDYDPTNPNVVYFVRIGRASHADLTDDIFIARSTTGGAPDPQVPGSLGFPTSQTFRITDAMLGETVPHTEHHLSVAVTHLGGIAILFYTFNPVVDVAANTRVRCALWANFADIAAAQPATTMDLAANAFADWGIDAGHFDYAMVKRAGCKLYAAYPTSERYWAYPPQSSVNTWDMWVSVIDPQPCGCCAVADANGDGRVNIGDASAFYGALATNAPLADANHDHAVNVADVPPFVAAYSQASGPP
jgi:hypothetical protein